MVKQSIMQFGMIRSGSTLIYNLLRKIFPERNIIKTHEIHVLPLDLPIVCTYRDPLAIICSSIKRYKMIPSRDTIEKQIIELNRYGYRDFNQLESLENRENILVLRYEKFFNNTNYVFNQFEEFFNIDIKGDIRKKLENEFSIKNVKKLIQNMDSFDNYDEVTQYHGLHISDNNGKVDSYLQFFNKSDIDYLKEIYMDFRKKYSYD